MRRIALAAAFAAIAVVPVAEGHVEVDPARAPAGDDARLTFAVPNERADAKTRRIVIQMPTGVTSVRGLALRGWRLTTRESGGTVRRVTLTAPRGRELTGEERARFRMRVGLPSREGETLVFKVLQVYDSGEIVRWLGPPGTSEPAARLRLTAAREQPAEPAPAAPSEPAQAAPDEARDAPAGDGDGDDGGVPIWAGIGLILLAAVAGSTLARRRNRRRLERRQ
jgi:uncharacterized protein YcnI